MNTLILIVFVPIIALAQQGLFFSLDAAEVLKPILVFLMPLKNHVMNKPCNIPKEVWLTLPYRIKND